MKKILVYLLSFLLLLSMTACSKTDPLDKGNDNTPKDADKVEIEGFSTDEIHVQENVKNFSIAVKISYKSTSDEGVEETTMDYALSNTDLGYYIGITTEEGTIGILFENEGAKSYLVDLANETIYLVSEGEEDEDLAGSINDFYESFLFSYTDQTDELIRRENMIVAGRQCVAYDANYKEDGKDVNLKVVIDKENGMALKSEIEIIGEGTSDYIAWEVTDFKVGNQNLSPYTDWQMISLLEE